MCLSIGMHKTLAFLRLQANEILISPQEYYGKKLWLTKHTQLCRVASSQTIKVLEFTVRNFRMHIFDTYKTYEQSLKIKWS